MHAAGPWRGGWNVTLGAVWTATPPMAAGGHKLRPPGSFIETADAAFHDLLESPDIKR
jgi:hypothetical protein